MITLSYGFKKPQSGDKGNVFFPALEQDIQQINDHSHDGVNSKKLDSKAIAPTSDTILALNWVAQGGGTFKQTVIMPAGLTFDSYGLAFRVASGPNVGDEIHPSIKKNGPNTFDIYINDSTVDLTVLYLV